MFRKAWFRVALVLTVLASLMVTPLFVSAETANGITAPAQGAKISGAVAVTGLADDPNFKRWDLFIFPAGNEGAKSWVASGNEAGKFSADLDTAKFANGDYTLSLRVVTNPKQDYSEYLTNVTIANAAAAAPATPAKEEAKEAPAAPAKEEAKEAPAAKAATPVNGFDLKKDAKLSGAAAITGYADDPNFKRWDLFIFPAGNEGAKSWVASGSTAGKFTVDLDTAKFANGDYTLSLRVVTNPQQNYSEYLTNVMIANAAAAAPTTPAAPAKEEVKETPAAAAPAPAEKPAAPANGLDLKAGAKVSGTITITGYADDPNFKRWDLFIFPAGNEGAKSWVASGNEAGKFSVAVDTTKFANGEYTFSLRIVTNPKQDYSEHTVNFVVANPE